MEINANTSVLSRCIILRKKVTHTVTIPFLLIDYAPTYDFCQAILSHGDFVEVLEPQWFRIQIGATIQKCINYMNKYHHRCIEISIH